MIKYETINSKAVDIEVNQLLEEIIEDTRGIMVLAQFIIGLTIRHGTLKQRARASELVFLVTHNSDGTLIAPHTRLIMWSRL